MLKRDKMVGFYDNGYKRIKTIKRRRRSIAVLTCTAAASFLLAWSTIPSPFGTDLGNSLALAFVGAFISVGIVEAMELMLVYEEILEDCWRKTLRLHDYSYDTSGLSFLPFYLKIEDAILLIDEIYGVKLPRKNRCKTALDSYCQQRAEYDQRFAALGSASQSSDVFRETEEWIGKLAPQIEHYYNMRISALSVLDLKEEILQLPFKSVKKELLAILDVANELSDITTLDKDSKCPIVLTEKGWGDKSLDFQGIDHCSTLMNHYEDFEIDGKAYNGQHHQVELYKHINRLSKMRLSNAPSDEELKTPWGSSICEKNT